MVRFNTLWDNHPTVRSEDAPCKAGDHKAFDNQCAVKMGVCLERSGVNTKAFHGARCWQGHKPGHILRAEELAKWLAMPQAGFFRPDMYSGKEVFDKIRGKTGMVFFRDYYGPGNQGDHIDLWNGNRLTDWFTWARIHIRIGSFGVHSVTPLSDFEKAKSIWFWRVI